MIRAAVTTTVAFNLYRRTPKRTATRDATVEPSAWSLPTSQVVNEDELHQLEYNWLSTTISRR